jgi:hypothetical protein
VSRCGNQVQDQEVCLRCAPRWWAGRLQHPPGLVSRGPVKAMKGHSVCFDGFP